MDKIEEIQEEFNKVLESIDKITKLTPEERKDLGNNTIVGWYKDLGKALNSILEKIEKEE